MKTNLSFNITSYIENNSDGKEVPVNKTVYLERPSYGYPGSNHPLFTEDPERAFNQLSLHEAFELLSAMTRPDSVYSTVKIVSGIALPGKMLGLDLVKAPKITVEFGRGDHEKLVLGVIEQSPPRSNFYGNPILPELKAPEEVLRKRLLLEALIEEVIKDVENYKGLSGSTFFLIKPTSVNAFNPNQPMGGMGGLSQPMMTPQPGDYPNYMNVDVMNAFNGDVTQNMMVSGSFYHSEKQLVIITQLGNGHTSMVRYARTESLETFSGEGSPDLEIYGSFEQLYYMIRLVMYRLKTVIPYVEPASANYGNTGYGSVGHSFY